MSEQQPIVVNLELNQTLLANLEKCFDTFSPDYADLSKIRYYDNIFDQPETSQGEDLEKLGQDAIRAMSLATDYYYVATRFAKYASALLDKSEAQAYFIDAPRYLASQGNKDTDAARKMAVAQLDAVLKVRTLKDAWLALADWLNNRFNIYLQKHHWVRKQIDTKVKY